MIEVGVRAYERWESVRHADDDERSDDIFGFREKAKSTSSSRTSLGKFVRKRSFGPGRMEPLCSIGGTWSPVGLACRACQCVPRSCRLLQPALPAKQTKRGEIRG